MTVWPEGSVAIRDTNGSGAGTDLALGHWFATLMGSSTYADARITSHLNGIDATGAEVSVTANGKVGRDGDWS